MAYPYTWGFLLLKKSNIGRQYETRKLKNPDHYKYPLWKMKTLKSLMILFTLLHSPCCKSLLSLHTPALVICCWSAHIWQVYHMPGQQTKNHSAKEIIHKSLFLVLMQVWVVIVGIMFTVHSTLPVSMYYGVYCIWGNRLLWKTIVSWDISWCCNHPGMDTLSTLPLVLSNKLFIPALREFGIALYGKNPISFLYWHNLWILCFTSTDHRECS